MPKDAAAVGIDGIQAVVLSSNECDVVNSGPPQRGPEPGQVRSAAVDLETGRASAAESAEAARSKLASFQRGSRRARATAQMNRGAQPGQDD